ncbi:hypothetical protein D3C72_1929870 [compost metagenome]
MICGGFGPRVDYSHDLQYGAARPILALGFCFCPRSIGKTFAVCPFGIRQLAASVCEEHLRFAFLPIANEAARAIRKHLDSGVTLTTAVV